LTNREQKRQFDEAVRRIEAELRTAPNTDRRRKLSPAERRRLHDEITKQHLTKIEEIKDWGLAMFPR
jgi:hypothetical protein